MIDIFKNGINFYLFCADVFSLFTSTLETFALFSGGIGYGNTQYIPVIGTKIP
jgi:hypothetical protein